MSALKPHSKKQIKKRINKTPLEETDQKNYVLWFEYNFPDVLIHHSPNEGNHTIAYRLKQEKLGVKFGWPDLEIIEWNLFIELKRKKGGSVTKNQKGIHEKLRKAGSTVVICKGFEAAKESTLEFIKQKGITTR